MPLWPKLKPLLPVLPVAAAAAAAILLYRTTSRLAGPTPSELAEYLKTHSLQAGVDVVGDFQQVYFLFNGNPVYITEGQVNHMGPVAQGSLIAWTATPPNSNNTYLHLYDTIARTSTQLTYYGTVRSVGLYNGNVVWEENSGAGPQVKYFDGRQIHQVSRTYPSVSPAIRDGQIIYAQDLGDNRWQTMLYRIDTGETKAVVTGTLKQAGFPRFTDSGIVGNQP